MKSSQPIPEADRGQGAQGQGHVKTVAVIENDPDLQAMLERHLEEAGYRCWCESNGQTALKRIAQHSPDLILLGLMPPGLSGTNLLAELRRDPATRTIPVIVLTAHRQESDELVGFALGADDYVAKPFAIDVLLARIRAVLRRAAPRTQDKTLLNLGPFTLSRERNEVTVGKQPILLTRTEFQLLREVLAADGRVVRRDRLIEQVFATTDITDRRIDVHMTNLRRKLGIGATWIQTIRGVGYACRDPLQPSSEYQRQKTSS